MTIRELTTDKYLVEDNSKKALSMFAKTLGKGFYRDLWAYKRYEFKDKKEHKIYCYLSGTIHQRHKRSHYDECYIDGIKVSKYEFIKALEKIS